MGIFRRLKRKVEQAKRKEDVKVYRLAGNDWYAVLEDDD